MLSKPLRASKIRVKSKAALLIFAAIAISAIVLVSMSLWLARTSAARLANEGVNATATATGEVCSFEVKKYRGSYVQYAAMYGYTVDGRRHETRGTARFGAAADVPTNATAVQVRYLPSNPTVAIAHDERIQHTPNKTHHVPKVTTDCSK